MNTRAMCEIKEKLCKELDKLAGKSDLSNGEMELAYKLVGAIKNIGRILEMDEDGLFDQYEDRGRSGARRRDRMGRYAGDYTMDGNYTVRGGRSYDNGGGGYSNARGRMADAIDDMMDTASPREREILRRAADELKSI